MRGEDIAPRLGRLPVVVVLGLEVPVARDRRSRLLGLAFLSRESVGAGLLIPGCSAVHTFWMRFELDAFFLAADGSVLSSRRGVPSGRVLRHRGAAAVLELPGHVCY